MPLPNIIVSPPFKYDHTLYAHFELPLEDAIDWIAKSNPVNRCISPTCKAFDLEPIPILEACKVIAVFDDEAPAVSDYEAALLLLSHKPLTVSGEYTKDEILAGGLTCLLIVKTN